MIQQLEQIASERGLKVVDRGNGHYQIVGGAVLVNYYPGSKLQSAYIAGTRTSHKFVSVERAVDLALAPVASPGTTKCRRKSSYRAARRRMWGQGQRWCYRCGLPIKSFDEATLDHKIPLSRGGLDNRNNYALSHAECNQSAGNSMPRLK